ncbi:MAG: hypothetical protein U1F14_16825 [Steroidobacteraceae bacterium]
MILARCRAALVQQLTEGEYLTIVGQNDVEDENPIPGERRTIQREDQQRPGPASRSRA